MISDNISYEATVFNGMSLPEKGIIVGYGALIRRFNLELPFPKRIAFISEKNRKYATQNWLVFTPSYLPEDTIYKQLVFALKYEGVQLLFFKKFFQMIDVATLKEIVSIDPNGQYCRRIWFLYEWLQNEILEIENADSKLKYVPLINSELQYCLPMGEKSSRHKVINNLLGTPNFSPTVFKTPKINQFITSNLHNKNILKLKAIHKDILYRTAAFLLLKDSKASFNIEGENPGNTRASRWGKAIGQAGKIPISKEELIRLQQIIIENSKFIKYGYRQQQGFVGEHDRDTFAPIPDHISAKWQDLDQLMTGLLEAYTMMKKAEMPPIIVATVISFGFVIIHPFVDGNGRLHRYLIHHILSEMNYYEQGLIFPISASILSHLNDYRKLLEGYSLPILAFIHWEKTKDNNLEILNETIDYYKFINFTEATEFLCDCVNDTVENIIPMEVNYLINYDEMKNWLDDNYQMPDKTVALLIRFLEQNKGKLSKRAIENEFSQLESSDIQLIEAMYLEIMNRE